MILNTGVVSRRNKKIQVAIYSPNVFVFTTNSYQTIIGVC